MKCPTGFSKKGGRCIQLSTPSEKAAKQERMRVALKGHDLTNFPLMRQALKSSHYRKPTMENPPKNYLDLVEENKNYLGIRDMGWLHAFSRRGY
jgi:hypothetical protein